MMFIDTTYYSWDTGEVHPSLNTILSISNLTISFFPASTVLSTLAQNIFPPWTAFCSANTRGGCAIPFCHTGVTHGWHHNSIFITAQTFASHGPFSWVLLTGRNISKKTSLGILLIWTFTSKSWRVLPGVGFLSDRGLAHVGYGVPIPSVHVVAGRRPMLHHLWRPSRWKGKLPERVTEPTYPRWDLPFASLFLSGAGLGPDWFVLREPKYCKVNSPTYPRNIGHQLLWSPANMAKVVMEL